MNSERYHASRLQARLYNGRDGLYKRDRSAAPSPMNSVLWQWHPACSPIDVTGESPRQTAIQMRSTIR